MSSMTTMHSIPIIRRYQTTDQTAPWEGVIFTHEVGTDELAEALKDSFPQYRTLREREHAAVIKFFEQELQEMQSCHSITMPGKAQTEPDLPRSAATMGMCNGGHLRDFDAPSPSPASSPSSLAPPGSEKRVSAVQAVSPQSLPVDPTLATSSTQLVFNAFDGRPMYQKTKRKMTTEERLEYRRTRQRGACAKCKRTKAKCTHMDNAQSSFNDASGLTESLERGISLETDISDAKPGEAHQVEHVLSTYSRNPDAFQQHSVPSQHPSRRSSNASDRSPTASYQCQWPVGTANQLDTSGYVHPSSLFDQHQGSFSDHQSSLYWSDYSQPDVAQVDPTDSFQTGLAGQDEPTFPSSPVIYAQGPSPEDLFPSAYLPFNR